MKTKLTFWSLVGLWLIAATILLLLNHFLLQISIFDKLIKASLGFFLLLCPVYPLSWNSRYSLKQCLFRIRLLAIAEILISFASQTTF